MVRAVLRRNELEGHQVQPVLAAGVAEDVCGSKQSQAVRAVGLLPAHENVALGAGASVGGRHFQLSAGGGQKSIRLLSQTCHVTSVFSPAKGLKTILHQHDLSPVLRFLFQKLFKGLKLRNETRQAIRSVHARKDRPALEERLHLFGLLLHLLALHHLDARLVRVRKVVHLHHHVAAVPVEAHKSPRAEGGLKAIDPLAAHDEVPRVGEELETDLVRTEHAGQDLLAAG
mmetsp:Transcript_117694/g.279428  ORF Transcript_117694/g.279428 Transcript_117694/m.279428 type:complete len:229 (-) Transcript_117694:1152-1838(-)